MEEKLLDKPFYKMILQPLVENAVKHGLEKKAGKGILEITSYCRGDAVYIAVSDNGCGMTQEKLSQVRDMMNSDNPENIHIGLTNVNKRLNLHYGKDYGLTLDSTENVGTKVTVKVPGIK